MMRLSVQVGTNTIHNYRAHHWHIEDDGTLVIEHGNGIIQFAPGDWSGVTTYPSESRHYIESRRADVPPPRTYEEGNDRRYHPQTLP